MVTITKDIVLVKSNPVTGMVECPHCNSVFHESAFLRHYYNEDAYAEVCPTCGEVL